MFATVLTSCVDLIEKLEAYDMALECNRQDETCLSDSFWQIRRDSGNGQERVILELRSHARCDDPDDI